MKYITHSEEETLNLGIQLSKKFNLGDVVLLEGELGVGKSVFIRGVAWGWGITEPMPSPTFTIVNQYSNENVIVNHFDFYRINDPFELYEIGFEEYIYAENGISFIEWPSKGEELLPEESIKISVTIGDDNCRIFDILWRDES